MDCAVCGVLRSAAAKGSPSTPMEVRCCGPFSYSGLTDYWLRLLNWRTAKGTKIAMITAGQMIAAAIACPSIQ